MRSASEEGGDMAYVDGRASRFRIADAGGVMRDLSAYITEVSGLPGARALNDVTAAGRCGRAVRCRAQRAYRSHCAGCSLIRRSAALTRCWGRCAITRRPRRSSTRRRGLRRAARGITAIAGSRHTNCVAAAGRWCRGKRRCGWTDPLRAACMQLPPSSPTSE